MSKAAYGDPSEVSMADIAAFAQWLMLEYALGGAEITAEPTEEPDMWFKRTNQDQQKRRQQQAQRDRRPYTFADVKAEQPEGFDNVGYAIGATTGVPISPTHGVSAGSLLGAAVHNSTPAPDTACHVDTTTPVDATPCDTGTSGDAGGGHAF